jgi:hypothetical protein
MFPVALGFVFSSVAHCLSDYLKRFVWGFIKIFTNAKTLLDDARCLLSSQGQNSQEGKER